MLEIVPSDFLRIEPVAIGVVIRVIFVAIGDVRTFTLLLRVVDVGRAVVKVLPCEVLTLAHLKGQTETRRCDTIITE